MNTKSTKKGKHLSAVHMNVSKLLWTSTGLTEDLIINFPCDSAFLLLGIYLKEMRLLDGCIPTLTAALLTMPEICNQSKWLVTFE